MISKKAYNAPTELIYFFYNVLIFIAPPSVIMFYGEALKLAKGRYDYDAI